MAGICDKDYVMQVMYFSVRERKEARVQSFPPYFVYGIAQETLFWYVCHYIKRRHERQFIVNVKKMASSV